jgi:hypothetical protein
MAKIRNLLSCAFLKAAFIVDPPHPHPKASAAPILDIESFCGFSTNLLTHFKRKYGAKNRLVTCDKWEFENLDKSDLHLGPSPILFSDYQAFVRESYLRNIQLFSADDLPFTVEATSEDFFSAWKENKEARDVLARPITLGGLLSFYYIDRDHSYKGVKKDFLNCDQFLESGRFLLFNDSTIAAFGVREFMPEVAATGRYKLMATNPNHLF